MAFGGRMLANPRRGVDETLAEVLRDLYRPKGDEALQKLMGVFHRAEDAYFDQWSEERFQKGWGIPMPGEFKLDQNLWGTSPGPATFLKDPCLDATGRKAYREGLRAVLAELPGLEGRCDDGGRLAALRRCVITTLTLVNTVAYCLGEPHQ